MVSTLTHQVLRRIGSTGEVTVRTSTSIDFCVDGISLLRVLVKADGSHGDFAGCIIQGHPAANAEAAWRLLLESSPDTESGRVLLYICPECGDIGCGAYSARIAADEGLFIWSDFAYENGYEASRAVVGVGPFRFRGEAYIEVVRAASAL